MASSSEGWKEIALQQQKDREERWQVFWECMREYPCSFNLGHTNLDVSGHVYNGSYIGEPALYKNVWDFLEENLMDDEDDEIEVPVWRQNLLTRVYAELRKHSQAQKLNEEILEKYPIKNIVALGNATFLYFLNNYPDDDDMNPFLEQLKDLQKRDEFTTLKVEALIEQGYSFRRFGGAQNLLNAIAILSVATPLQPHNDQARFLLAMVYRRCTHFEVYSEMPDQVDRPHFAMKAAGQLCNIGMTAQNKDIRSAALIELAHLKMPDECRHGYFEDVSALLSNQEWKDVVGFNTTKMLMEKAIEVGGSSPPSKTLKMAGQLNKYSKYVHEREQAKGYLLRSISIKPSSRAFHHLGLMLRKSAIEFERNQNPPNLRSQWMRSNSTFEHIPQPHVHTVVRSSSEDYSLRRVTKPVGERLHTISDHNPYFQETVQYLKQAVELSHFRNKAAIQDLAMLHRTRGNYDEAIRLCNKNINNVRIDTRDNPLLLVNAYDLCGVCYEAKAENADGQSKQLLMDKSEKNFTRAIQIAAQLARHVPELYDCATNLWLAFDRLERKFSFEGTKASKEKLFRLCELVSEYRPYLQRLDEILSKNDEEWKDEEALEKALTCYLKLDDLDSAMLFLDMIPLKLGEPSKLTWCNSETVRKVMMESAKKTILIPCRVCEDEDPVPEQADVIWRTIFDSEFATDSSSRASTPNCFDEMMETEKHDIVIVDYISDDSEDKHEGRIDDVSRYLKDILGRKCGLDVVRAHEMRPGQSEFVQQMYTIYNSTVTVYVFDSDCNGSSRVAASQMSEPDKSGEAVCLSETKKPDSFQVVNEGIKCGQSTSVGLVDISQGKTAHSTSLKSSTEAESFSPTSSLVTEQKPLECESPEKSQDKQDSTKTRSSEKSSHLYASGYSEKSSERAHKTICKPTFNIVNHFIQSSARTHIEEKKPMNIFSMVLGQKSPRLLPLELRDKMVLEMTDEDIATLAVTSAGDAVVAQTAELVMKLFKAIVRQN